MRSYGAMQDCVKNALSGAGCCIRDEGGAFGAGTIYEALGQAIDRFRRCERVKYDPQGLHEFTNEAMYGAESGAPVVQPIARRSPPAESPPSVDRHPGLASRDFDPAAGAR